MSDRLENTIIIIIAIAVIYLSVNGIIALAIWGGIAAIVGGLLSFFALLAFMYALGTGHSG